MHLQKLLMLTACLYFFASCKKNDDNSVVKECNNISQVIKYGAYDSRTLTDTIVYDEKGRVRSVTGGGSRDKALYEYYKDRIVLTATDIAGNDISLVYFLDGQGRIKSTSNFDYQYTYNSDGQLVSFRRPFSSNSLITDLRYLLEYKNGDLIQISRIVDGVPSGKISFEYYDEPNQDLMGYNQPLYVSDLMDLNTSYLTKAGFLGKPSAHLYKSVNFNVSSHSHNIDYSKDSHGRIVNMPWFEFIYQCP